MTEGLCCRRHLDSRGTGSRTNCLLTFLRADGGDCIFAEPAVQRSFMQAVTVAELSSLNFIPFISVHVCVLSTESKRESR